MMTAGSGSFGVTGPLTSWPGDPHANYPTIPQMPQMPQMMMPQMQAPTPVPGSAPVVVQSTPAPEPLPEIVGQP